MDESKIEDEVWQTIQTMNRLWTADGKADELKNNLYLYYT